MPTPPREPGAFPGRKTAVARYLRGGPPGSPQRVARNFLSAIEAFDCDTAWQYFFSQSQRAIQIASDKKKSDPFLSHVQRRYLEPENLYCLPTVAPFFHGYRASSVKLLKIQGTTATVAVKKGIPTGFLIPGFWPTRTRYKAEMQFSICCLPAPALTRDLRDLRRV
jgi:hypothetical protein